MKMQHRIPVVLSALLAAAPLIASRAQQPSAAPTGTGGLPATLTAEAGVPNGGATRNLTRVNPIDGATMIFVPAGGFIMGDNDTNINDDRGSGRPNNPRHKVTLSGYWIYKNLVTVGEYKRFCIATGREMPVAPPFDGVRVATDPDDQGWHLDENPMTGISWDEAAAYAKWVSADLPTEAQWEKAARWSEPEKRAYKFPWGDTFDSSKLWRGVHVGGAEESRSTHKVGEFAISPCGCTDMAGNVWQWCKDWYDPDYWNTDHGPDPQGPASGAERVQRGGSRHVSATIKFRSSYRDHSEPNRNDDGKGFRCVIAGPIDVAIAAPPPVPAGTPVGKLRVRSVVSADGQPLLGGISVSGPVTQFYHSGLLRDERIQTELHMTPRQIGLAQGIFARIQRAGDAAIKPLGGMAAMETYSRKRMPTGRSFAMVAGEMKEVLQIHRARPASTQGNIVGPRWYDGDGNEYREDEIEIRREPDRLPVAIYRGRREDRPGVGQAHPEMTSHNVGGPWAEIVGNEVFRTFAETRYQEETRAVKEILTLDQVARWKQICLQTAGVAAMRESQVADEVGLTSAQRSAFDAICTWGRTHFEESRDDLPFWKARPVAPTPNRHGSSLTPEQAQEVTGLSTLIFEMMERKLRAVLTPAQRAKWRQMVGPPSKWVTERGLPNLYSGPAGAMGAHIL